MISRHHHHKITENCTPCTDKNGVRLGRGARVRYSMYDNPMHQARHGGRKSRMGTVISDCALGQFVDIVLDGDPFPIYAISDRIVFADAYDLGNDPRRRKKSETNKSNEGTMPIKTKNQVSAKELRREAKSLGVRGWAEMDAKELKAAIREAQSNESNNGSGDDTGDKKESRVAKAKAAAGRDKVKKSAASKANAKTEATNKAKKAEKASDVEVAENGNPFRPGTNLYLITEELIKGGKRSKMVQRLSKKIDLKPRGGKSKNYDEEAELDRRILITGQILRNQHGFEVEREGRGTDATIVAVPPS